MKVLVDSVRQAGKRCSDGTKIPFDPLHVNPDKRRR